jgi:hypothetical protein
MGEKRVWEGICEDIGREELFQNFIKVDTGDKLIPTVFLEYASNYDMEGGWKYHDSPINGKRVRITIEVLDDDHLEMDKLERQ